MGNHEFYENVLLDKDHMGLLVETCLEQDRIIYKPHNLISRIWTVPSTIPRAWIFRVLAAAAATQSGSATRIWDGSRILWCKSSNGFRTVAPAVKARIRRCYRWNGKRIAGPRQQDQGAGNSQDFDLEDEDVRIGQGNFEVDEADIQAEREELVEEEILLATVEEELDKACEDNAEIWDWCFRIGSL
ncbi:hypothetical protein SELMODRAFT_418850 [Selaginella moellendorffii]|uniref:Uncharacterized protein n=1 Tax=Selaginella moellendorffii TaxID=88036 RepID=D8S704_SELML|nr:hypothetical protein SELMODRAFT_418850 [Selaginella moellendorffii]